MTNNELSYKTRLKVFNSFISILEEVQKDPECQEQATKLLANVNDSKAWLLDKYPAEEYLNDLPKPQ